MSLDVVSLEIKMFRRWECSVNGRGSYWFDYVTFSSRFEERTFNWWQLNVSVGYYWPDAKAVRFFSAIILSRHKIGSLNRKNGTPFCYRKTSLKSASRRCYFLYIPTTTPRPLSMAGLQCHAIEIKIVINHSVKLGYDRWLIYKPPRHDLGLCGSSFARYSEKCFTPICRALYRDAMLVRFGGTPTPGTNRTAIE